MSAGTTARIAAQLAGRTVATAESVTAGRLAAALADTEHASTWFRGGLVAYQTAVKRRLLGVSSPSVFSEDAAAEMAEGVAALLGADVAVTTSGVAGIEPVDGVEPGTVFVATYVDGDVRARAHRFEPEEPESICSAATERALLDLLGHLEATARERTAAPGRRGAIEPR